MWLLPLAAAVRIFYLMKLSATPLARHLIVDEAGYDLWAKSIAGGEILQSGPFYQAPLYPYLLGTWYAIFGDNLLVIRILQLLLGLISVALLYWIGVRVFGLTAGRVAGAGAALYLPFLFYEGQILKTTLALTVTLLLLVALLRAAEKSRRGRWFAAGLILGGLVLLRGNALLYLPFLFLWQLLRKTETETSPPFSRHRLHAAGLLLAGTLVAVSPATIHNLATGGELILTTYQGGTNFYIGNHPGAQGIYTPIRQGRETPAFEGLDATEEASRRSGETLSPAAVSRFWFREGLRFAGEHPGEFWRLQGIKLLLAWNQREIPDAWDFNFLAARIAPLGWPLPTFGWVAPLALLGLALCYPWRGAPGLVAWMTLATTLSISPFYIFARYRLPLAPLSLLLAGYAVSRGVSAMKRREFKLAAVGVVALVPCLAVVHLDIARFGLTFTDEVGHQNLGFLHLRDGRADLAEASFHRAIKINPDITNAWLALARIHAEAGRRSAEAETLVSLLGHVDRRRADGFEILDPAAEASGRQSLARLLRTDLRNNEAARLFRQAADLLPGDSTALIELGITLRLAGRLGEAADAYYEALERDPGEPLALYNLAHVEFESGDPQGAVTRLEAALVQCANRRPALCDQIRTSLQALQG